MHGDYSAANHELALNQNDTFDILEDLFHKLCAIPKSRHITFFEENKIDQKLRTLLTNMVENLEHTQELLDRGAISAIKAMPVGHSQDWIGKQLGDYTITGLLGEGGSASVFRAHQKEPMERDVAIKMIYEQAPPTFFERFYFEQSSLAKLNHPNIATVYTVGNTDTGHPYLVMEYIVGKTLLKHCDHLALTIPQRLNIFLQICEGIMYSHQHGILHRDIKPDNILVRHLDTGDIPLIIDFGIALELNPSSATDLDKAKVGTPEFMSPEHLGDVQQMDARSEVYSLGLLLLCLLVGKPHFERKRFHAGNLEQRQQLLKTFPPNSMRAFLTSLSASQRQETANQRGTSAKKLRYLISQEIDWIYQKATAWDKSQRYSSVHELVTDIANLNNNRPLIAAKAGQGYELKKYVQRNAMFVISFSMLLLFLLAFSTVTLFKNKEITKQFERAEAQRLLAEQEKARAEQEKNRAEEEQQILQQTTNLMSEMFASIGIHQESTEPKTPLEAVEQAYRQLEEKTKLNPNVQYRFLIELARLFQEFDRTETARGIYLSIIERSDAPNITLDILAHMGMSETYNNQNSEHKEYHKRHAVLAHTLATENQVPNKLLLSTLSQLSWAYYSHKDWDNLAKSHKEGWQIAEEVYGKYHVKAAYERNGYGYALYKNQKLNQAEQFFEAALKDYNPVFSSNDDVVQNAKLYLSYILEELEKDADRMIKLQEEFISTKKQNFGETSAHYLDMAANSGWYFIRGRQYQRVLDLMQQIDSVLQRDDIPKRDNFHRIKFYMAWAQLALGKINDARYTLKAFQEDLKTTYPEAEHFSFLWAELALRDNQLADADRYSRQALADIEVPGNGTKALIYITATLTDLLLGRFAEADKHSQKALEFVMSKMPANMSYQHFLYALQSYARFQQQPNKTDQAAFNEHAQAYRASEFHYPFYVQKLEELEQKMVSIAFDENT